MAKARSFLNYVTESIVLLYANRNFNLAYVVCYYYTIELGLARAAGDVWAWLRLELGLATATRSIWSLVGGIREPGWAESSVPDVWAGLRLELGLTRATRSARSLPSSGVETSFP